MRILSICRACFFLFLLVPHSGYSQVIISLLLGDKLNSGEVEFGLDGGANVVSQSGGGGTRTAFNLGFYFDIKLKNRWMYHTGVIVKSTMGAGGLPVYSLSDPTLDTQFAGGYVDRTMNYFNVPFMLKYTTKSNLYFEGGPQFGLLYNAHDRFLSTINGQELSYDLDVHDKFRALDVGFMGGIGYRLMKGYGMNLGIRYYLGFLNVSKETGTEVLNRSLYFSLGIPIGVGKSRQREEERGK